jgi:hypothetical protein
MRQTFPIIIERSEVASKQSYEHTKESLEERLVVAEVTGGEGK